MVYGRPPLVFLGLLCAIGVMWDRNIILYETGVFLLLISMSFDVFDGWFAARYPPHPTLASLADRIMDKIVYSTIFPLVSVGMMWRLIYIDRAHTRPEMLHAILVLILCITVLVRDNVAHFMRSYATQKGFEPETRELTRLRTMVAAPVGALLYIHVFYLPGKADSMIYSSISWLANFPLRTFFIIEIIFLIINFGSIAGFCRKYGALCLDEVCLEDDLLRRRILSLFPNALTFFNAIMGVLAVIFAYQGWIHQAFLFLMGATIFDKLDGALARKLGLTEPSSSQEPLKKVPFGAILDDIADGISFCLAPALIFFITLSNFPHLGIAPFWLGLVAFLYFIMGIGRLIYFTMDRAPIPGYFKGMPTPAAALLVISPLLMFSQAAESSSEIMYSWGIICFSLMIFAAVVMNTYPIHYLHIGRYMDTHPWFTRINTFIVLVSLFTPYFGYVILLYLVLYSFSPAVTRSMEAKQS